MRKLFNLFAANKGRGAPLAMTRNGSEVTVEVYDAIVSSEADAAWFGGVSADLFCRDLRSLTAADTLHIRVNSPGGDVFAGVAMAQAIRETPAQVTVHVDGYAASAASLLVAAADRSVIAPGAMVMIHKAWTIGLGNADDFIATAGLLEKIDGEIAASYQARAGGEASDWLTAMAAETWYTGREAVDAGLVTELATNAAKPRNSFDMSVYDRAPKVEPVIEPVADPVIENTTEAEATAEIERRRRIARATLATTA